jgi:hypothetical protein
MAKADNLYFSRDTKVYVELLAANSNESGNIVWEIPVLDGYSFSQAQNASEVTLSEMESATGESRRGRTMFNDSYAPAEWSFATYVRPFRSAGGTYGTPSGGVYPADIGSPSAGQGNVHAVEECLWALLAGGKYFDTSTNLNWINESGGTKETTTTDATDLNISYQNSQTSTLGEVNIYFVLGATKASATSGITIGGSAEAAGQTDITLSSVTGIAVGDVLSAVITDGSTFNTVVMATPTDAGDTGSTPAANTVTIGDGLPEEFAASKALSFTRTATYKLENCVVDSASVDFDIDGIATINWSGLGKIISQAIPPTPTITEGIGSTTNFIRNRLTALDISTTANLDGETGGAVTYALTLTGGNITFSNNIAFLTPETLGSVNQPFAAIAGTRTIGGNFTCYLNTGDEGSGDLFSDLVGASTVITNNFDLVFNIGGKTAATNRLEVTCSNAHLELPTHSIDDVISVDVNFHALPSTISGFDEAALKYIADTGNGNA